MVIRVLDHVDQCYTADDGAVINALIRDALARGEKVVLAFDGVGDVPSSFVNAALVKLLADFSYSFIRSHLSVKNSTRQINDMISRRMQFVAEQRQAA